MEWRPRTHIKLVSLATNIIYEFAAHPFTPVAHPFITGSSGTGVRNICISLNVVAKTGDSCTQFMQVVTTKIIEMKEIVVDGANIFTNIFTHR